MNHVTEVDIPVPELARGTEEEEEERRGAGGILFFCFFFLLRTMCSFTVKPDGNFDSPDKTVLNSPLPVTKYCYFCKRIVWTKIKYYPTFKTRVLALGLSFCLLCWLPFFLHWKSEVDHHCIFCDCYLGTYNPTFQHANVQVLLPPVSVDRTDDKKQPQKKYREVGRRCGDYSEAMLERDEIMRVYSDVLH